MAFRNWDETDLSTFSDEELLELKVEAEAEQKYHENISLVKKIQINSAFGAASMKVAPFSQGKVTGSSITISGRMANQMCALYCSRKIQEIVGEDLTEELSHIAQADTDSFYLDLTTLMKIDKFKNLDNEKKILIAKKMSEGVLQDIINDTVDRVGKCMNLYEPSALAMENEVITEGFVSLKNKRYYTRVKVNDGVILDKPKMKVVGVSLVSYSTPEYIREKLKPVLDLVLDGKQEELHKYIKDARAEFGTLSPKDFSRTVRVSRLDYELKDGKFKREKENGSWLTAPLGSTSTLEHNRVATELDIVGKFPLIERGDSISFVYTVIPNKLKVKGSIGWSDPKFIDEIGLREFADYEKHWDRDFLHKIEGVVEPLGWNVRKSTETISVW